MVPVGGFSSCHTVMNPEPPVPDSTLLPTWVIDTPPAVTPVIVNPLSGVLSIPNATRSAVALLVRVWVQVTGDVDAEVPRKPVEDGPTESKVTATLPHLRVVSTS
jgi:hypothetical protein